MMNEDLVKFEIVDNTIAVLRLNRPGKLNALSTPLMRELATCLDRIEATPDLRAVVLTGEGASAFAAGADVEEYRGRRERAFADFQFSSRELFDRVERFRLPTIAAIEGYALGGGFELALCCDVLVVSESARLGLPEGKLGLCPGGGGTQRLTRSIGRHLAADVLLSARMLSGERAYQIGLAAELASAGAALATALDKARYMRRLAPLAQTEMKRLMRLGADASLPAALSLEQETLLRLYASDDAQEGIDAFLDKRNPHFKAQ